MADKFDLSMDKATLDLEQIDKAVTRAVGLAREDLHRRLESDFYRLDRLANATEADFMLRAAESLHLLTRVAYYVKESLARGEVELVREDHRSLRSP